MKKALIAVIFLAISLLVIHPVHGDIIEVTKVAWGSLDKPTTVSPGDSDVSLYIAFTNLDKDIICAVQAWLSAPPASSFPFTNWDGSPSIYTILLNQVRLGESAVLKFDVDVSPDAKPGVYTADLRVSYRDCTDSELPVTTLSRQVRLTVSEPQSPVFLRAGWYQNGVEVPVGPGSGVAELVVWFEVPKDLTVSNVVAELMTDFNERIATSSFIGTVSEGGSFSLSFPVDLSAGPSLGRHEFSINLSYRNQWLTPRYSSYVVGVDIVGREDLNVEQDEAVVGRGSHGELSFRISNEGTAAASKLELLLTSQSPSLKVLKNFFELTGLAAGQSTSFKLPIYVESTASSGPALITLSMTYQDVLGRERRKDFQLVVEIPEEVRPGFVVRLERQIFNASRMVDVGVEFINSNPYTVSDVRMSLSSAGTPITLISGEPTVYVKSMNPNTAQKVRYVLAIPPSAADSTFNLKATIEYRDSAGQSRVETYELPVVVRGDIEIMLRNLRVSPLIASPGESIDVVGDLVNSGTSLARAVTVELAGGPPFKETVDSSSFVGLINPSQVSSFNLAFQIDDTARPGTYTATIKVTYRNGFGEGFTLTRDLEYRVEASQTSTATGSTPTSNTPVTPTLLLAVVAVVSVLAGFLAGRAVRKR
ncbi:hypothetical protein HRbin01_00809 [archaeon HR01]|nr:hypothetical protein HRbin01_00809 [archaeon HR01]